jgi:PemK-like, MazF-like toxin of type II toxin-antitoxin system
MPLPTPEPGLVLSYEFLWSHEAEAGQDQGEKKRPAVVVLATKTDKGQTFVTVAPITHSEPKGSTRAIEVPPKVKQHLGLDSKRSWIICNELNEFVWPGFDLYPIPKGRPGQFDYGFIPPVLYEQIRKLILDLDAQAKKVIAR